MCKCMQKEKKIIPEKTNEITELNEVAELGIVRIMNNCHTFLCVFFFFLKVFRELCSTIIKKTTPSWGAERFGCRELGGRTAFKRF